AAQPSTDSVARAAAVFAVALADEIDAPLDGVLPPHADPGAGRTELETLLAAAPVGPGAAGTT
ncbi:MAG TPA: hypothetical protein VIK32_09330, partial [Candidatus Limnocylindrales bacterium]